jgi:lactoylglutathione lyase
MKPPLFFGLRTTIYKVSDINKAKEWYAKVFEIKPYFNQAFYVGFNIGGYELGLQPESEEVLNKTANVVTYWGVSDIDKLYTHFINNGAFSNEKPTNVGGDIMTATVVDPWGNTIGIIYNPDFKLPN